MLKIRVTLLATIGAAGAFFFACTGGGPEKVDAEDWVDDLCAATEDLADAEGDAYDDYDAEFADSEDDGEAVRDALTDYVDAYKDGLDEFEDALNEAGEPDVRDGGKVVDAVKAFIEDERKAVDDAEEDVEDLEEDGEDLVFAVDDIFLELEFADLLGLLEDSDSPDADDIIELIDEDEECAAYLFVE